MSDSIKHEIAERLARVLEREGFVESALTMRALLAERDTAQAEAARLREEVASLRLTLGGRTFDASVPEPIGCPLPGACQTVAEIVRLREALKGCVMAHETGIYDAACAACEEAKEVLGMVPDPACALAKEAGDV